MSNLPADQPREAGDWNRKAIVDPEMWGRWAIMRLADGETDETTVDVERLALACLDRLAEVAHGWRDRAVALASARERREGQEGLGGSRAARAQTVQPESFCTRCSEIHPLGVACPREPEDGHDPSKRFPEDLPR